MTLEEKNKKPKNVPIKPKTNEAHLYKNDLRLFAGNSEPILVYSLFTENVKVVLEMPLQTQLVGKLTLDSVQFYNLSSPNMCN